MKRPFILLLILISAITLKAQQWVVDSHQVNLNLRSLHVDPLANRYIVTDEMQILKFRPDGSLWQRYENNRLGSIGTLDVTNPFMVLVFYPQYQTLILLDNNMAETGRLNFSAIGFGNIRTAGISDDNNIWILDEGQRQLIKITTAGERVIEGVPYFGYDIATEIPIFIQQKSNYVYISQPNNKVQVFDIFGKWVKALEFDGFQAIIYINKNLYIKTENFIIETPVEEISFENKAPTIEAKGIRSITYDVIRQRFYGINTGNSICYLTPVN